jgi:hypothetical protein
LKKRHRQQSLEGLPIEESPFETVSREDEDSSDDDVGSQYDTTTFLAHFPDMQPYWCPLGVDLLGIEGSLSARRGGRGASRRKGPSRAFREGIYLAWGPLGEIGGAAPVSPITSDSADGLSNDGGVGGQGAIDGCEDSRPDSLIDTEDLRRPISLGSEEH